MCIRGELKAGKVSVASNWEWNSQDTQDFGELRGEGRLGGCEELPNRVGLMKV